MASYYNVGRALGSHGRPQEAIEALRRAVELDPNASDALNAYGLSIYYSGNYVDSLGILLRAIELDKDDPGLMALLAVSLARNGRYEEAVSWHIRAANADHARATDRWFIRSHLCTHGRHEDARKVWEHALTILPRTFEYWNGYADLAWCTGNTSEYSRARSVLLELLPELTDPLQIDRTIIACLLDGQIPADQLSILKSVTQRADAVSTTAPSRPARAVAQALIEYRAGNHAAALLAIGPDTQSAATPFPTLLRAMALYQSGDAAAAIAERAHSSIAYDWRFERATTPEAFAIHALRREADILLIPDLSEIVAGNTIPTTDDVRIASLAACQTAHRFATWARLWSASSADANTNPKTASGNVICTLALAAAGAGADSQTSTPQERDTWRESLYTKLSAQINGWIAGFHKASTPADREHARKALQDWMNVSELVSVRDASQLSLLPSQQHDQWSKLWQDVQGCINAPPLPALPQSQATPTVSQTR